MCADVCGAADDGVGATEGDCTSCPSVGVVADVDDDDVDDAVGSPVIGVDAEDDAVGSPVFDVDSEGLACIGSPSGTVIDVGFNVGADVEATPPNPAVGSNPVSPPASAGATVDGAFVPVDYPVDGAFVPPADAEEEEEEAFWSFNADSLSA